MNTKHCNICDQDKPCSDFHLRAASRDGLASRCKDCQKKYDKDRANALHRKAARDAYRKTERGKLAHNKASKAWSKRYPLKRAAQIAVGNALRDGKLSRKACEVCGNPRSEAHHDDYSKPLEVMWLCDTHHKNRHAEINDAYPNLSFAKNRPPADRG